MAYLCINLGFQVTLRDMLILYAQVILVASPFLYPFLLGNDIIKHFAHRWGFTEGNTVCVRI